MIDNIKLISIIIPIFIPGLIKNIYNILLIVVAIIKPIKLPSTVLLGDILYINLVLPNILPPKYANVSVKIVIDNKYSISSIPPILTLITL